MINMLIGQPGGGKSYEAVAFHVLPALQQGRKVVTNLPLDIEAFRRLDPSFPALLDIRTQQVEEVVQERKWNARWRDFDIFNIKRQHRPFASIADYGDEWRHPKNGAGVLYVIDECHLALPRARPGTAREVEEWFSMHRHELADVLLITQSYGKVCKAICDMVQVLYRVKKATAFGTSNRYIRKVQDGIGGEVVNTSIREYEKKYFPLYKSHTKSSDAGKELAANDIVPIWRRWPVLGAGLCFLIVAVMLLSGGAPVNPMTAGTVERLAVKSDTKPSAAASAPAATLDLAQASSVPPAAVPDAMPMPDDTFRPVAQSSGSVALHPFAGITLHISAFIQSETRWRYSFTAEQNGQPVGMITQSHLEESGYKIEKLSECSARISFEGFSFYAICDLPRVQAIST